MKLLNARIRGMPGFEQLEHELRFRELSPTLNLLTGPNGSGKTTTCRAIEGLLWPELLRHVPYPDLEAEWEISDGVLTILRQGDKTQWLHNGRSIDREGLSLPGVHLRGCFFITLDDLFRETAETEASLAASVQRELLGGFNVQELRTQDRFKIKPRAHGALLEALREAREKAEHIKQRYRRLQDDEAELARLDAELGQALDAQHRLQQIEHVAELRSRKLELAEAEMELEAFHPCSPLLSGDEGRRLAKIEESLGENAHAAAELEEELRRSKEHISHAGIAQALNEAELTAAHDKIQALAEVEHALASLWQALARQEGRVAELRISLRSASGSERLETLEQAACADFESLQERYLELSQRKSFLEWKRTEVAADIQTGLPPAAELQEGITILGSWLSTAGASESGSGAEQHRVVVLLSLLVIVLCVAGAYLLTPWSLLPAIAAIAALWSALRRRRGGAHAGLDALRAQYERLELQQPADWEPAAVDAAKHKLEAQAQLVRLSERAAGYLRHIEHEEKTVVQELAPLAAKLQQAQTALGLPEEASPLLVSALGAALREFLQCSAELAGLRAQEERLVVDKEFLLSDLNKFFAAFGVDAIQGSKSAASYLEAIRQRNSRLKEFEVRRKSVEEQLAATVRQRALREQERIDLLQRLGLAPGEEHLLQSALAGREQFLQTSRKRDQCSVLCRMLEQRLNDDGRALLNLPELELQRERAAAMQQAGRIDEIRRRKVEIETECRRARQEHDLEEALTAADAAYGALAEARSEALTSVAAHLLLDEVEADYEIHSQPQVLKEAGRLLALFTRGRYELSPVLRGGEFRARDVLRNRELKLQELSCGTRVQIILAIRVAFAERHEGDAKLPLFLDEVLSSSDPERYRAVAEALLQLAAEGRQVFYLSCQPGDVEAWEQLAAAAGVAGVKVVGLAAREPSDGAALLRSSPAAVAIEPPNGRSIDEYARRLGAPSHEVDDVRVLHLAHLVEAADTLYRLLCSGISTYGQLKLLAARGDVSAYITEAELQHVTGMAEAFQAALEVRGVGHGRKFAPQLLLEVAGQSAFFDRLIEVAESCGWDSKRFIEAIDPERGKAIKRFQAPLFEKVREALERDGYYNPYDHPLSKDEARARFLSMLNETVKQQIISAQEAVALFEQVWHRDDGEEAREARA